MTFKKLFVFGDSYQKGDELPQATIPNFAELSEKEIGVKNVLWDDGRFPFKYLDHPRRNQITRLEKSLISNYEETSHALCMGGRLHSKFNFDEYKNFSQGGHSQVAIYTSIMEQLENIDEETLVLVGATYVRRTSRFTIEPRYKTHIKNFNNYSHVSEDEHHDKFIDLLLDYGNDLLFDYISVISTLQGIARLLELQGCKYIIIDPLNIFRENSELDNKVRPGWRFTDNIRRILENHDEIAALTQPKIISDLQTSANNLMFRQTLHNSIYELSLKNHKTHCVLGHPNADVHQHFADNYLIPYIKKIM